MDDGILSVNDNKFCLTPTARRILKVLTLCTETPKIHGIGLIVGAAGVGKTTTINHFAARNPSVRVCTMNGAATTKTAALSLISQALMGYTESRIADINHLIVNYLKWFHQDPSNEGCNPALIIDEAQEVNDKIINQLRHIHDQTGAGLILCGNAAFKNRFNHVEASAFAQVTSRIGMRADIPRPTEEDIEAICDFTKISGDAETAFVRRVGRSSGALRAVTRLINIADALPDAGQSVSINHLKAAAAMMGLAA